MRLNANKTLFTKVDLPAPGLDSWKYLTQHSLCATQKNLKKMLLMFICFLEVRLYIFVFVVVSTGPPGKPLICFLTAVCQVSWLNCHLCLGLPTKVVL